MKSIHLPGINARYWTAITLASVFGTNLGDFYAHDSGLGIGWGLVVLAALAGLAFAIERSDDRPHEAWYWLVIIIIRTGATNIADYLAFRIHLQPVALGVGLVLLLALLGWFTHRTARANGDTAAKLPDTDAIYWMAMLTAGVLGTVLGDDASHLVGKGPASIILFALLAGALLALRRSPSVMAYWATVGIARTAGTAIGDFLAEGRGGMALGLPLSSAITGLAFVLVLIAWPRDRPGPALANREASVAAD